MDPKTIFAGKAENYAKYRWDYSPQAIHWFDPEVDRQEMERVLKRNGWLAILRNYPKDDERYDALSKIVTEELGVGFANVYPRRRKKAIEIYFGTAEIQKLTFGFQFRPASPSVIGCKEEGSDYEQTCVYPRPRIKPALLPGSGQADSE